MASVNIKTNDLMVNAGPAEPTQSKDTEVRPKQSSRRFRWHIPWRCELRPLENRPRTRTPSSPAREKFPRHLSLRFLRIGHHFGVHTKAQPHSGILVHTRPYRRTLPNAKNGRATSWLAELSDFRVAEISSCR
jgi:hypothetical protein